MSLSVDVTGHDCMAFDTSKNTCVAELSGECTGGISGFEHKQTGNIAAKQLQRCVKADLHRGLATA